VAHVLDGTGAGCWPSTFSSRGCGATVCPRGKPEIRPLRPAGARGGHRHRPWSGRPSRLGRRVHDAHLTTSAPPSKDLRRRSSPWPPYKWSADTTARLLRAAALEGPRRSHDERRRHRGVDARAPHRHTAALLRLEAGGSGRWSRSTPGTCTAPHPAAPTTAWASCLEGRVPPTFDPPDVPGRDLVEVMEGLVALTD
jgi:hypothetical protein